MARPSAPVRGNLPQGKSGALSMVLFGLVFAGVSIFILSSGAQEKEGDDALFTLIMGGVFVLAGLGISGAGILALKKAKQYSKLAERYKDEPWLLDKQWASGRIKDRGKGSLLFLLSFAFFWNLISWTATISLFNQGEASDKAAKFIILLFPLIGIGLIVAAVYTLARWLKFGTSVFEMAEVPGVVGGSLGGVIKAKAGVYPRKGITLNLQSVYRRVTGSGKQRQVHEDTLWEGEQIVPQEDIQVSGRHSFIPVLFEVPYECKSSEKLSSREEYLWKLKAKAALDGIDYASEFIVPVFKTENSRPDAPKLSPKSGSVSTSEQDSVLLKEAGVLIRTVSSGDEIRFEHKQRALFALIPLVIGGMMFSGAVLLALMTDAPFIFPLVLGGFGMIVEVSSLSFLISKVRLIFGDGFLEIRKSGLTGQKEERIPFEDITDIVPFGDMSIGSTVFFCMKVERRAASTIRIPTNIKGQTHADAVCRLLKRYLQSH